MSDICCGTILIVDDTPANLGVVVESLETHGFRVFVAQDGEEALARADFAQPDLILLDVMMPGLDGFEVCRRLKGLANTRDIPVIFMTSLAESADRVSGFEAGAVDYVTKPLHIDEVLVRARTHLSLSAVQRQLEAQNALLQRHREELEQQVAVRTAELSASNRRLHEEIGERKRAEDRLHARERELRSLLENTPDTISRYDRDGRCIYANPRMVAVLGAPWETVSNLTPAQFPIGVAARTYQERLQEALASGRPSDFELAWQVGETEQIISHIRLNPEFGANGDVISILAVGRDITEIDEYRQNIHHLAFHDLLTDLPNRGLLSDCIRRTIAEAGRHGHQFGLMVLDLDRFKQVNDTLGHNVGDQLLCQAADRLKSCVRRYDTIARLGGDEFAILVPHMRKGGDLATIARKILAAFHPPFSISGKELFISASIGIALYPEDSVEDSVEVGALCRYADLALYHAKKLGRNNFQFYSRELTAHSSERMALEAELRKAQKNLEFELYYQPQVDLASARIVGAEALLRWNHRGQGMITPDKFIPVAEDTGLIVSIGEWVLSTACQAAVAWNRGRDVPFPIAVNLSTRQFMRNDLLGSVRRILAETQCQTEWLKLEITESLLLEDSDDILDTLNAFSDMGLAISIDDFGTGYSALSYLNRFPVSQIKIDRSFVRDIPGEQDKSELVKAMISIANALQLELVAEGVETGEQTDYLSAHGCRIAQGYLFGKPVPRAEFEALHAVGQQDAPPLIADKD